ncbi:MAG: hypothetical protein ACTHK7_06560 [Aureliella sp.]
MKANVTEPYSGAPADPNSPVATGSSPAPKRKPRRVRLPQLGLSTLLLATACVAAWGSAWMNARQSKQLAQQVASMRSLARELVIKDREHIAIIQQHAELYDQQVWHVYIPSDSLGLHLVTRNIPPLNREVVDKHAGLIATAPLSAGRHKIELRSERGGKEWVTQVLVDDQPAVTVRDPEEWNAGRGSSGGGHFAQQADLPADEPAVLFSRVFMVPEGKLTAKLPAGPGNGIVLWIDRLEGAQPAAR